MKRGVCLSILLILFLSTFASAQSYSLTARAVDDFRMFFAGDKDKVNFALEIREKQLDGAIESARAGNIEEAIRLLKEAKKKLEIVQDKASPETVEEIEKNIEETKKKLLEIENLPPEFEVYINNYVVEEEKTKLSVGLSEKLLNYCTELANQDYEAMLNDEKCKSKNAPTWLKSKVDEKINELDKQSSEKMLEIFTTCINDPRECDCSEIIGSAKTKCEEGKALAIKCEFQNDESACNALDNINLELPSNIPKFLQPLFNQKLNNLINNKQKEGFEKFAPQECVKAGATTREKCEAIMMEKNAPRECVKAGATTKKACEKIMNGIHGPPPTECMENGEFIGPEACDEKMVKSGRIPQECIKGGKPIPPEECNKIMGEKGMGPGGIPEGVPQECIKGGKPLAPEDCMKLMQELGINPQGVLGNAPENLPPECMQNGQPIPEQDCIRIMQEKGIMPPQQGDGMLSGKCREQGITDFYDCQKIMNMPSICKDAGISDSAQCEERMMTQNMPRECVEANALTPDACRKIMLPQECRDIGASSWEDCEAIRIRQQMPQQCQQQGKLTIGDCAKVLAENVIAFSPKSEMDFLNKKGIRQNEIPGVCMSGSNFIRSMECDAELAQMGITLPSPSDISNIPRECMRDGTPVSPQECEENLKTKIVNENIPGPCREAGITDPEDCGKLMENERREQGLGLNIPEECIGLSSDACKEIMNQKGIVIREPAVRGELPRECVEIGVDDTNSCNIIMSRINEERMKNGDQLVVDSDGNQDYITPDEVNEIIKKTEQNLQIQPDLETAESYKQQVEYYEQKIDKIKQTQAIGQGKMQEQGGLESGGRSQETPSASSDSGESAQSIWGKFR